MTRKFYNFGQIFRLEHVESGSNDWYILAVMEPGKFALINLVWGSKMSAPMEHSITGGVSKSLLDHYAKYFLKNDRYRLIPVFDCELSYMPVVPKKGRADIGYNYKLST